jgi:hypothetical protein
LIIFKNDSLHPFYQKVKQHHENLDDSLYSYHMSVLDTSCANSTSSSCANAIPTSPIADNIAKLSARIFITNKREKMYIYTQYSKRSILVPVLHVFLYMSK